ncbi:MAG: leucine-rich repeat domain-containing protein, partial [Bacteroidales bacterium]|nr:leucine-rich repeat domain-containing protein [Bacteroidales bacterium]
LRNYFKLKPNFGVEFLDAISSRTLCVSILYARIVAHESVWLRMVVKLGFIGQPIKEELKEFYSSRPGYAPRTTFQVPDTVKEIESSAFNRTKIEDIIIPDSVVSIGERCFQRGDIRHLHIGVANMEPNAIEDCKIGSISVSADNTFYRCIDGVLYNNDVTRLILCPANKNSIEIPSSVEAIGPYAFYSAELECLNIPQKVTVIGERAFSIGHVKKIILHSNICSIGYSAFDDVYGVTVVVPVDMLEKCLKCGNIIHGAYREEIQSTNESVEAQFPKLDELPRDDDKVFVPVGSWNYYYQKLHSKKEEEDCDEEDYDDVTELVEVSREMQIQHIEKLRDYYCSIANQKEGVSYFNYPKLTGMYLCDDPMNIFIKKKDGSVIQIYDLVTVDIGGKEFFYGAGSILRFLGFDFRKYLLTSCNAIETKDCIGKKLAAPIMGDFIEDFVDEDNGDVVTIARRFAIAYYGDVVDDRIKDYLPEEGIFVRTDLSDDHDIDDNNICKYIFPCFSFRVAKGDLYYIIKNEYMYNDKDYSSKYNIEILNSLYCGEPKEEWTQQMVDDLCEDYLSLFKRIINRYDEDIQPFRILFESEEGPSDENVELSKEIENFFQLKIDELKKCKSEWEAFKLFKTDSDLQKMLKEILASKNLQNSFIRRWL